MASLYYSDFFDKLRKLQRKLDITLITESSQRSSYFLDKIKWPSDKHATTETADLPCFIISDKAESLVAFSEQDCLVEVGHKKKVKSTAVWTNYEAIVSTLLVLFEKKMP